MVINPLKVAKEVLERMNVMKLWVINNDLVPHSPVADTHRVSRDSQPREPWCCSFSKDFCCYLSFLTRLASRSSHTENDLVWAGAQCCAGITGFVLPQTAQHRFASHRGRNSAVCALSCSAKEGIWVEDNSY